MVVVVVVGGGGGDKYDQHRHIFIFLGQLHKMKALLCIYLLIELSLIRKLRVVFVEHTSWNRIQVLFGIKVRVIRLLTAVI